MDRPQPLGKAVDPATRLSDLLAQSLEELTRPFDPPRPPPARVEPRVDTPRADTPPPLPPEPPAASLSAAVTPPPPPPAPVSPEDARIDADKALAELEAELFAAAKEVDRQHSAEEAAGPLDSQTPLGPEAGKPVDLDAEKPVTVADKPAEPELTAPTIVPEPGNVEAVPAPDADAEKLVARVRKLMMVSMAVTMIAVGSVFAFIGYRVSKGDGVSEKRADKLPAAPAIPADVTLSIPRGARVVQSSVAADRLIITLEIDGKLEVRTFDVTTLQPAGRLNFSATP